MSSPPALTITIIANSDGGANVVIPERDVSNGVNAQEVCRALGAAMKSIGGMLAQIAQAPEGANAPRIVPARRMPGG